MTQFAFLQREWPAIFEAATRAENAINNDPRTACFYARRPLELDELVRVLESVRTTAPAD